ncbi:MAG: HAMP domain-containing protein [Chloroflexaceae bacterium]|nr:HAMP domain-containing protein [Chloroflexaceae bacterium]
MVNMETGERGFAITGEEGFLEPYDQGLRLYNETMALLREQLSHNEEQLDRLQSIDEKVQNWREVALDTVIELRHEVNAGDADLDEMSAMVSDRVGKERFDAIRDEIMVFRNVETDLLETRSLESENAANFLQATLIGGTLLAALIGLVMAVVISGSIAHRVNAVASAATSMADGHLEDTYHLPEGKDEVGLMATAFTRMANTIRSHLEEQRKINEDLRAANATRVAKEYLEQMVRTYSQFANDVARGNLTARLSLNGRVSNDADELVSLGSDLNLMVDSLHRMTLQVQQASTNIAAASAEILAATTQQASSTTEQSSAITQTSTTLEEVKSIAQHVAQQANQVSRDSQEALKIAHEGTQAVEHTVISMGQIRERVESIAQTILSLSEQTQAISAITTTVSELADQSNLLALNAAIEAARAGEQGRSFAVVAQNVRDLAERSKAATVEVRSILEDIQRATNAAVMVTEEGSKRVDQGVQLANQAGEVIHRITTEVQNESQTNLQMAAAAHQQQAGMEQIGQAMTAIQQATTQTVASTRQAERAAQDLHTLAQSLQKTIASYQL